MAVPPIPTTLVPNQGLNAILTGLDDESN